MVKPPDHPQGWLDLIDVDGMMILAHMERTRPAKRECGSPDDGAGTAGIRTDDYADRKLPVRLGEDVLYVLSATDAILINQRRDNFQMHQHLHSRHKHPHEPGELVGEQGAPGYVAHVGTPVHEGDELPAKVVHVNGDYVGLVVFTNGSDLHWVSGVKAAGLEKVYE